MFMTNQILDFTQYDLRALIEADFGPLPTTTKLADAELDWLHFQARTVPMRPRRVIVSTEAESFRATHPTITTLERKLRVGEDVRPWLSNSARTRQADPRADMLFNDWQIIHFHLSDEFGTQDAVKRTGPLLFAYLSADHVVFLTVKPHKNSFALQEYLRILLRTNPQDMESVEIKGINGLAHVLSDEDIFNMRKNGVNTFIEIGGRFFAAPGQGVVASKHALRLSRFRDMFHLMIEETKSLLRQGHWPEAQTPAPLMTTTQVQIGLKFSEGVLTTCDKLRGINFLSMKPLE
ncbi:hypothetical protein [Microvirga lenta]|uniref:hypothetical protein n=1 Tax=Microvirga lenta TaxID=2881337 RepID=UPI001CFCD873|nr:hypothetical protein [Microvirga lenta]MCB5173623.1 hypothetical protein [Microvirga lenta]